MPRYDIPFNKPCLIGSESRYVAEAMNSGHFAGDGAFTRRCHHLLESELPVPKALLTTSCTHALEMAAILLDIRPGDEVIVPSFTFVSTVNAFVLRGAIPVFADIRPDTLNLNEDELEPLFSERTKALVAVHYAGVGCEMDRILDLAGRYGVDVVEDNAHGLFGKYKGRSLGTLGSLATQSFHETKNFTCGEGGALLINDAKHAERAEIIREKGTNRSRFFRGQVDKYSWVDIGSSYLASDILAAVLCSQLEERERIQERRAQVWKYYYVQLENWSKEHAVRLPVVPDDREQAFHMFYLLMPSLSCRQALIEHLKTNGIMAVFHYLPLHLSEMGRKLGARGSSCVVTEEVSDRLVRLPFFFNLTDEELERVVKCVQRFRC